MSQDNYISIGEAAKLLGVSVVTMRRWEKSNKVIPDFRTFGTHRRYLKQKILSLFNDKPCRTICYSRVSSHDQKKDLITQDAKLIKYCHDNNLANPESIMDLGSGLNFKKKGLNKLLAIILNQQVNTIVINHKERLLRFGSEIVFKLCEFFNINVIIAQKAKPSLSSFTKNQKRIYVLFWR
jgi:putative resolvase